MAALEPPTLRRRRSRGRTIVGLALAVFALAGLLILVLGDDQEAGSDGAADPGASPELVTAAAVSDNPARWLRRDVTVAGEIADVIGPGAYALGAQGGPFRDGLLVVTREPEGIPQAQRPLLENDLVQVSGEVRTFDKGEIEAQLGRDLEDDLARRNGDPVLVADQIVVTPRLLPIGEPASIKSILARPREHVGSLVAVSGRVTGVYGRGALVLDDRIVVLLSGSADSLPRTGERVRVSGAVRPFDLDELAARTRDDVDDDLFGDLVDRPAIVAFHIERQQRRDR